MRNDRTKCIKLGIEGSKTPVFGSQFSIQCCILYFRLFFFLYIIEEDNDTIRVWRYRKAQPTPGDRANNFGKDLRLLVRGMYEGFIIRRIDALRENCPDIFAQQLF